ncbi:hypothetical protein V8G54_017271 [Vigna mungo]|uniref:Uncharacterized protein n=1 Tax=Vigna mungo TaxID=3915 RepID=A0AAQ3NPL0_VIGMU
MIKESHVEYEKLHIENCQESSQIKCPKSYLVSLKRGKPKCETARNWGQRGSTERGKETPLVLTIKLQWMYTNNGIHKNVLSTKDEKDQWSHFSFLKKEILMWRDVILNLGDKTC